MKKNKFNIGDVVYSYDEEHSRVCVATITACSLIIDNKGETPKLKWVYYLNSYLYDGVDEDSVFSTFEEVVEKLKAEEDNRIKHFEETRLSSILKGE